MNNHQKLELISISPIMTILAIIMFIGFSINQSLITLIGMLASIGILAVMSYYFDKAQTEYDGEYK